MQDLIRYGIILGNMMDRDAKLNEESTRRANLAIRLSAIKVWNQVVVCGWAYRNDCNITLADAMKEYICSKTTEMGQKIFCQRLSRDTVGDALFTRLAIEEVMKQKEYSIDIVTSHYHSARACAIFTHIFPKHISISIRSHETWPTDVNLIRKEITSLTTFWKMFNRVRRGDIPALYSVLQSDHPFYNGSNFPKIGDLEMIIDYLKDGV